MPAHHANYLFKDDHEVICTTEHAKPLPYENSETRILIVNNRPGLNSNSIELKNFTSARYIRMRFQGMFMTQNEANSIRWLKDEEQVLISSYYSLRHIIIFGRCLCNGHANECQVNENFADSVSIFFVLRFTMKLKIFLPLKTVPKM